MYKSIVIKDNISKIIEKLPEYFKDLDLDGSLFTIVSTEYDIYGCVKYDFMNIIDLAVKLGFIYINTIVYPTTNVQKVAFCDNVRYIVWFCKDNKKYDFNKDKIREKHIWKDVEWGKRTKNYNEKGKDPGNVWIPTEDDGKAHITNHVLLTDDDVIDRLIKMTNSEDSHLIIKNEINISIQAIQNINHPISNGINSKVIFSSSEKMDEIEEGQISLTVTSPPYWNLKDYFKEGQIGQETYTKYIDRMTSVWREAYKKMDSNGSLWININIRVQNGKVILIPFDIINECKKLDFYYKGIIIWHKSSGIPSGFRNLSDHYEYVLIFSKDRDFSINRDENKFQDYKNIKINKGAFWNINRKAGSVGKKMIHPAIYPNELVSRIVLLTTSKYNYVLDPFLGSGTSLISSNNNCRSFIGYEYNEGFKELMLTRFNKELNSDVIVNFIEKN